MYVHSSPSTDLYQVPTTRPRHCVRSWLYKDGQNILEWVQLRSRLSPMSLGPGHPLLTNGELCCVQDSMQGTSSDPGPLLPDPLLSLACPSAPVCCCFDPAASPSPGSLSASLIWSPEPISSQNPFFPGPLAVSPLWELRWRVPVWGHTAWVWSLTSPFISWINLRKHLLFASLSFLTYKMGIIVPAS